MSSIWYGKTQASKLLGLSEASLWMLKNTAALEAGKHWLYSTGKKASTVLFNVEEIRNWQIEQTKITEDAPLTAAQGIATYQKMGA